MKRITPKMMKDGIPKNLESSYENYFKMEDRYDKVYKLKLVKLGKRISYLLRHDPEKLEMDDNGWISVMDLLYYLDISKDMLDDIVETNDKKRFSYSLDGTMIRANQGHSIDVDVELEETKPPRYLYHGTSNLFMKPILKYGLNKMKRKYVHLSEDYDTAVSVGKRHSKNKEPVILTIDSGEMSNNGHKFYLSKNGVWLTDNVPPDYIRIETWE